MAPWIDKLVRKIEHNLENRSLGWGDIDPKLQQEIRDEMVYTIAEAIKIEIEGRIEKWLDLP